MTIETAKRQPPSHQKEEIPDYEYAQGRQTYTWGCGCMFVTNPHSQVLHECSGNDCQRDPDREPITLYKPPKSS